MVESGKLSFHKEIGKLIASFNDVLTYESHGKLIGNVTCIVIFYTLNMKKYANLYYKCFQIDLKAKKHSIKRMLFYVFS